MSTEVRKFVLGGLLIAVIITLIGAVLFTTVLNAYYLPVFPYLLAFVVGISILIHSILIRAVKKNQQKFFANYVLTFAIKFFAYLSLIVIYFFVVKKDLITFSVAVVFLYVVFSFYEVRSLITFIKRFKN